ncbi:MAG: cysteine desulfurase [Anaerolineae bacterium]|nr:cysteine desulfurase [Anaerolineae bacterium]
MNKPTLPYDVEAIRADFPILQQAHHDDVPLVFLDNAASSQKPNLVIDGMTNYYRTSHANVHRGIYQLSEQATQLYEDARKKVRDFIHASSHREIIYTRGTTEGINLVAMTWGRKNLGVGDVVLSTAMAHHSNIVPWQILAEEKGFMLKFVPILDNGTLDMEAYRQLLEDNSVKLVTVVHSSNVLGTINPIKEMAHLAHEQGALILIDGAQSVPHMPVNVQDLDCDFFAFSGHKMLGPTGIGILYGKRDILDDMPPYMGGGDMIARVTLEGSTWNDLPYKFEAGTPSIAPAIGLGLAVDYLSSIGMDKIHQHEQIMTEYALDRLAEVAGLTVYGPPSTQKGAVAAFTINGAHAHDVAQVLDSYGIAVRAGHHCAMPLHQLLNVNATARASFYLYNTLEEIDMLAETLEKVKDKLIF